MFSKIESLISNDADMRNAHILELLDSYNWIVTRSNNEFDTPFKYYASFGHCDETPTHIKIPIKYSLEIFIIPTETPTLIKIPIKYIKYMTKHRTNDAVFVFEFNDGVYYWIYDESQVMINYNYNQTSKDIEFIMIRKIDLKKN